MEDSPQLAMRATGTRPPDDRDIGAFKIGIAATAPPTEDAQRRRVDALVRWLIASFTRETASFTPEESEATDVAS